MMTDELPDLRKVKREPELSLEPSTSKQKRDCYIIPDICLICGKPTKCYHYDIASCNGCKIFFRRTIMSNYKYRCHNQQKCPIDKGSPCRSCRLDKCILVGMNPKAIQFPKGFNSEQAIQKVLKRKVILEEKLKSIKQEPKFEQTDYCKEIECLLYLEKKVKILRESSYNPTQIYNDIREILNSPSELGNAEKYEKPSDWPINWDKYHSQIADGENICQYLIKNEILDRHWVLVDFIIIVEAAKAFPVYQKICDEDKILLLEKIGLVNSIIMARFYSLAQNSTTLTFPDGIMPIKICTPQDNNYKPDKLPLEVFCRSLEPLRRTNLNTTEFVLLEAIIACYTAVPKLSNTTRILLTKQREAYALILLRYLQSQLGKESGAKKYTDIICLVETYFYFTQKCKQLLLLCSMNAESSGNKSLYKTKLFDQILLK